MRVCVLENIEDLFETKSFIDRYLIESNKATDRMELNDFILKYCNLSNKIYVNKGEVIPFELHNVGDENILILPNKTHKDELIKKLKSIKYNFGEPMTFDANNLEYFTALNNEETDYFIINKKVHKC